jgi:glutamate dehydrogenase/leucine dehydrogenase
VGVFDKMAEHGHEQVVFCFDRQTGMRAIIAIHDTALGPARGGTRYKAYASEDDALEDVLRLSKGMTYKFAFTDMPRGGGKAVLLKQDGTADKRVLLRSFGRFVQLLAGRFGTGPDLGTSAKEMVDIARETDFVWAIDQRFGGTGDSTPLCRGSAGWAGTWPSCWSPTGRW